MDIIGIVAEYNPFHLGHKHHLFSTKELLGKNAPVVCVMSGDFVQRGEWAMYSKFARAEAACRSGIDLVVELPLPWALSSAEGFARGAVELLSKLGVTKLSFGSELGNIGPLRELAQILADDNIYNEIKSIQRSDASMSFAAARQLAVEKRAGGLAMYLATPNNILGIEYIKAINRINPIIEPVTIARIGSAHDKEGDLGPKSASEIREMLRHGEDVGAFVPVEAQQVYIKEREQGRELSDKSRIELAILSRLSMLEKSVFENAPDASGGLGARIFEAVQKSAGLDEIYKIAKTKRYALSRVRRICLCAALGVDRAISATPVPYARVLAANHKGCELLRSISDNSDFPVITKPAHARSFSPECAQIFALGAKAHDVYAFSYAALENRKPGEDWKQGPQIVKN